MTMVHIRKSRRSPFLRKFLSLISEDTIVGFTIGLTIFLSIKAYAKTDGAPTSVGVVTCQQKQPVDAVATVAFAVSVTGCGEDPITEVLPC
jgi:MFS superfamily sulfate permease-like transporter